MVVRESLGAVARRPHLWFEAIRLARATTAPGSLLPDDTYAAWRVETAYGDANHALEPDDLIELLEWRRRQRKLAR